MLLVFEEFGHNYRPNVPTTPDRYELCLLDILCYLHSYNK